MIDVGRGNSITLGEGSSYRHCGGNSVRQGEEGFERYGQGQ